MIGKKKFHGFWPSGSLIKIKRKLKYLGVKKRICRENIVKGVPNLGRPVARIGEPSKKARHLSETIALHYFWVD